MLYKKKNRSKTWIVVALITIVLVIGGIIYFAWPKNRSIKSEEQVDLKKEVKLLQEQLSSLKIQFNNLPTRLENEISVLESRINNLSSQEKQDKSVIQLLEREIKELKKKLESNKPDENPKPSNKKEKRLNYKYPLIGKDVGYYVFDNTLIPNRDPKVFYISQNHPQIKKLLSQEKLQENKQFIIRYGKIDKESSGKSILTFNESNKELEIIEI